MKTGSIICTAHREKKILTDIKSEIIQIKEIENFMKPLANVIADVIMKDKIDNEKLN